MSSWKKAARSQMFASATSALSSVALSVVAQSVTNPDEEEEKDANGQPKSDTDKIKTAATKMSKDPTTVLGRLAARATEVAENEVHKAVGGGVLGKFAAKHMVDQAKKNPDTALKLGRTVGVAMLEQEQAGRR
eukprot:m.62274 g.62274  ORF g.62274 m.62274 type:complete len:133 (-) comp23124_c0_seq1:38-436(-)